MLSFIVLCLELYEGEPSDFPYVLSAIMSVSGCLWRGLVVLSMFIGSSSWL